MSISAAQASQFYREVAESGIVWGIRDIGGFPAPIGTDGQRAMPFWSSESRASNVIRNVPAYRDFKPEPIKWQVFCERWVPGLVKDGLLAGINWSGESATGFDVQPVDLKRIVEVLNGGKDE
jgi:hypothetical protein